MPTTYRATLTNVGAALVADAIAQGTTLTWAKMALGDGNGSAVIVDAGRTSLVNERYRASLNDLGRDSANPNTIVGTLVVPPETGGWTIREFGIYDNASTPRLVAYGETPEIEKPASAAGTGINLRLRFKLVVSADANITLSPDSNEAYATIEYVKDNAVKSLNVRGRTITYTMGDGDTHTIQTQDTTYSDATQSVHGLMSTADKKKLDDIAANAEVNQNAFSNVKVGNVTVAADGKTDTLELVAGTGITLTPDATNDKVTFNFVQPFYIEFIPPNNTNHGGFVDFHFNGNNDVDYTSRIIEKNPGQININGLVFKKHVNSLGVETGHLILTSDTSYLRISAGTNDEVGSNLLLTGPNYNDLNGMFSLAAKNNTDECILRGYPNGVLTWDSNAILTTVTGVKRSGDNMTGKLNIPSLEISNNTPFIDFHYNNSTDDYTSRIIESASGVLTINGLKFNSNKRIYGTSSMDIVRISGGSTDATDGASLALYGIGQSWSGHFLLQAKNSTTTNSLHGTPDGKLEWSGKAFMRSIEVGGVGYPQPHIDFRYNNGENRSGRIISGGNGQMSLSVLNNNVEKSLTLKSDGTFTWEGKHIECAEASASGKLKLSDGTLIQWGKQASSSSSIVNVVFPEAFINEPQISAHYLSGSISINTFHLRSVLISNLATNGFKMSAVGFDNTNTWNLLTASISWIAIGRWK